jgi:RNA polymerase sigma-70 factor (ECF subfamily)
MVGRDEAHDVVHDTYLAARERLEKLRDPRALEAWLIRIAVNRCVDHHRRGGRLVTLDGAAESRSRASGDPELRQMIEALPPRERTILVLHYGHGYRLGEIADLLSLSATNVRTIIARTRQRLLRALREADA